MLPYMQKTTHFAYRGTFKRLSIYMLPFVSGGEGFGVSRTRTVAFARAVTYCYFQTQQFIV